MTAKRSATRASADQAGTAQLPYAKPLELAALPAADDLAKVIGEVLDATRFTR